MPKGLMALLIVLAGCQNGGTGFQQVYNFCSQNGTNKNIDQVNACINYQTSVQQAEAARRANASARMMAASAILLSNNRPPPTPTMSMPVNCVTSRNPFGGQVYTTCR